MSTVPFIIKQATALQGVLEVPGDKSISHRSVMLGSLCHGTTEVSHFLQGADCLSTISCFQQMGIEIIQNGDCVTIHGGGMHVLHAPKDVLNAGNSGTTVRLISGILSATNFSSVITGDASIQKRPMGRIITPLSQMGADICGMGENNCAPLTIHGKKLHGITYSSPVASAQVKSSILLAGLFADGETTVTEPNHSRNHTELMLESLGVNLRYQGTSVTLSPVDTLHACTIEVPGDISSAAYFIVAGLIVPNSQVTIRNVGINPTRDGILRVCRTMGAHISLDNIHEHNKELVADITVNFSELTATTIEGEIIPTLIDELPVIAIMACFAKGTTVIRDAAELKVKESNRIQTMSENLRLMGADIEATEDGFLIHGGKPLHGATINSYQDHRVAMSFAVAALASEGETFIYDADCVNISYPNFYQDLISCIAK